MILTHEDFLIQHNIEEDFSIIAIDNLKEPNRVDVKIKLLGQKNPDYVAIKQF